MAIDVFLSFIGKLKAGETVLVHAGGSGVGTAATQLAKQAGQSSWKPGSCQYSIAVWIQGGGGGR